MSKFLVLRGLEAPREISHRWVKTATATAFANMIPHQRTRFRFFLKIYILGITLSVGSEFGRAFIGKTTEGTTTTTPMSARYRRCRRLHWPVQSPLLCGVHYPDMGAGN